MKKIFVMIGVTSGIMLFGCGAEKSNDTEEHASQGTSQHIEQVNEEQNEELENTRIKSITVNYITDDGKTVETSKLLFDTALNIFVSSKAFYSIAPILGATFVGDPYNDVFVTTASMPLSIKFIPYPLLVVDSTETMYMDKDCKKNFTSYAAITLHYKPYKIMAPLN